MEVRKLMELNRKQDDDHLIGAAGRGPASAIPGNDLDGELPLVPIDQRD